MGRFVYIASFLTVCLLLFSPSLLADRVVPDFFDHPAHSTDADFASIDSHSAFFESRTSDSNGDHSIWLVDFDDHHGKAWGWHKHHKSYGDGGWNGDEDNGDTDDDSGNTGSTSSGGATLAVPEPSVLVLLPAALAAFLLKSRRRATV